MTGFRVTRVLPSPHHSESSSRVTRDRVFSTSTRHHRRCRGWCGRRARSRSAHPRVAEEAGGHRAALVQRQVGVLGEQLVGRLGDHGLQGERGGEVDQAVDVDEPVGGQVLGADPEVPSVGAGQPVCLDLLGVEQGTGLLHGALDLGERALVRDPGEVRVDVRGGRPGAGRRWTGRSCGPSRPAPHRPPPVPTAGGAGTGSRPRHRGTGGRRRWTSPRPARSRRSRTPRRWGRLRRRPAGPGPPTATDVSTTSPGCSSAHATASWNCRTSAAMVAWRVSAAASSSASTCGSRVLVGVRVAIPQTTTIRTYVRVKSRTNPRHGWPPRRPESRETPQPEARRTRFAACRSATTARPAGRGH